MAWLSAVNMSFVSDQTATQYQCTTSRMFRACGITGFTRARDPNSIATSEWTALSIARSRGLVKAIEWVPVRCWGRLVYLQCGNGSQGPPINSGMQHSSAPNNTVPCNMAGVHTKPREPRHTSIKCYAVLYQGSEVPGSGGGYCTHKRTHNVPMARKNGGKWGKMGENGGKWGGNGGKRGKMGKNKETWVVQPDPFPPISSPFPPHFPPFSPIFPNFPPFSPIFPRELSPFSPIFPRELSPMRPPPPTALLPTYTLIFGLFSP